MSTGTDNKIPGRRQITKYLRQVGRVRKELKAALGRSPKAAEIAQRMPNVFADTEDFCVVLGRWATSDPGKRDADGFYHERAAALMAELIANGDPEILFASSSSSDKEAAKAETDELFDDLVSA